MNTLYYTYEDIYNTYSNVGHHINTRKIITRHSTNKTDIREIALANIDTSKINNIIDIGCGYGFFTEFLLKRINKKCNITGIDIVGNENQKMFLQAISKYNVNGQFINDSANCIEKFEKESCDCIVLSYSIYFFPHIIDKLAQLLTNDGYIIILTHSENTLIEILNILYNCLKHLYEISIKDLRISKLFQSFSSENGFNKLFPYFSEIKFIEYQNNLVFNKSDADELINYIKFKEDLIFKDILINNSEDYELLINDFYNTLRWHINSSEKFYINKNDGIYIASKPKRR